MHIVTLEPLGISSNEFKTLTNEFTQQGHSFQYYLDRKEDEATLIERMHNANVVVFSNIKLSASVLSQCPNLQMLSVAFTGLDHIDIAYCKQHNIIVQNSAGYSTTAVSELAIGLMIDVLRHITTLDGTIRQGAGRGTFLGRELRAKTVGVVGTGAIGTATVKLLTAFGCNILAWNRREHNEVRALGAHYCSLNTLLQQSDIVTLHIPLNSDTYHMIDTPQLALMPSTSILINTARGNIVNIDAVAQALNEGRLAGAAFDVYEGEPPLNRTHPLLQAHNCICMPHVGFATREAFAVRANIVFDHVRNFLCNQAQ